MHSRKQTNFEFNELTPFALIPNFVSPHDQISPEYPTPTTSIRDYLTTTSTTTTNEIVEEEVVSDYHCIPNERHRVLSKNSAYKVRYPFRLVERNAICVDPYNLPYQFGAFDVVSDATECAEMCVNYADVDLQSKLRGFNYLCSSQECRCLYDRDSLTGYNVRPFSWTNWGTRIIKGAGPISDHVDEKKDAYCFSLISSN